MKVIFIKVAEFRQEFTFYAQASAAYTDTVGIFRIPMGFIRFGPAAEDRMLIGAHHTYTDQETPGVDQSGPDDGYFRVGQSFE